MTIPEDHFSAPTAQIHRIRVATLILIAMTAGVILSGCGNSSTLNSETVQPVAAIQPSPNAVSAVLVTEGQQAFRFDTFGDEQLWTGKLGLNDVIEKKVDPMTALKIGLKVDADVLPPGILEKVDLKSPATTVALLKMNAIVGVQATVDANNHITQIGVTCALCHSTVDNSVMPGIGRRQDGWPNRDLNVGAIIALSPAIPADKRVVYNSWGPGKYDPRYNEDGKNTPLVIPPAYGLTNVKNETYTAEGPISYWNAYVAVTQMGGQGTFSDPRLGIEVMHSPDLVTPKLAALRDYQFSLPTPMPPAGSFDLAVSERGHVLFDKSCAGCHVGGSGTDNNNGTLHAPAETGVDAAYAMRTANKAYRTTPLRALWQHAPYFHDGSAKTLTDVVTHYNKVRTLNLTTDQQRDLVEYLKSR
jgi:cytochrome c5